MGIPVTNSWSLLRTCRAAICSCFFMSQRAGLGPTFQIPTLRLVTDPVYWSLLVFTLDCGNSWQQPIFQQSSPTKLDVGVVKAKALEVPVRCNPRIFYHCRRGLRKSKGQVVAHLLDPTKLYSLRIRLDYNLLQLSVSKLAIHISEFEQRQVITGGPPFDPAHSPALDTTDSKKYGSVWK